MYRKVMMLRAGYKCEEKRAGGGNKRHRITYCTVPAQLGWSVLCQDRYQDMVLYLYRRVPATVLGTTGKEMGKK